MTFRTLVFILFLPFLANAQEETLTIMQYNLTYYGNTGPSFIDCDNVNNSTTDKDGYLSTIIDEVLPDVFGVNELGNNINYVEGILDNVMNSNGRDYYKRADMNGSGDIINMLYYNSNKLELHSEDAIIRNLDGSFITRHIDVHTLYYKDPDLGSTDTVFMTFIVAHLKAGSGSDDQNARDAATEAVMNYLQNTPPKGYWFFMGDLNARSSAEIAIQNLVNHNAPNFNFVDPINQLDYWQSSTYANIHTQSTRDNNSNGGCFATGGMDDRFDMILMTQRMEYAGAKVQYVSGSYKAFGQDGNAYNNDLRTTNNSVVSTTVAQALYDMSDHLPVVMDIGIYPDNSGITGKVELVSDDITLKYQNPIQHTIEVEYLSPMATPCQLEIINANGQTVLTKMVSNSSLITVNHLKNGLYIVRLSNENGPLKWGKLVKSN